VDISTITENDLIKNSRLARRQILAEGLILASSAGRKISGTLITKEKILFFS